MLNSSLSIMKGFQRIHCGIAADVHVGLCAIAANMTSFYMAMTVNKKVSGSQTQRHDRCFRSLLCRPVIGRETPYYLSKEA